MLIQHLIDLGFVINREKSVLSSAQNIVSSGFSAGLCNFHRPLFHEQSEHAEFLPLAVPRAQNCSLQAVHSDFGTDGFHHHVSPTQPFAHKGFSALGNLAQITPRASWHTKSECHARVSHARVPHCAASLAPLSLSDSRGAFGSCHVMKGGHDGCKSVRIGRI